MFTLDTLENVAGGALGMAGLATGEAYSARFVHSHTTHLWCGVRTCDAEWVRGRWPNETLLVQQAWQMYKEYETSAARDGEGDGDECQSSSTKNDASECSIANVYLVPRAGSRVVNLSLCMADATGFDTLWSGIFGGQVTNMHCGSVATHLVSELTSYTTL